MILCFYGGDDEFMQVLFMVFHYLFPCISFVVCDFDVLHNHFFISFTYNAWYVVCCITYSLSSQLCIPIMMLALSKLSHGFGYTSWIFLPFGIISTFSDIWSCERHYLKVSSICTSRCLLMDHPSFICLSIQSIYEVFLMLPCSSCLQNSFWIKILILSCIFFKGDCI